MSEKDKASAEELDDAQANDDISSEEDKQVIEEEESEFYDDESEESEDEESDEDEEEEEVVPQVPLDKYTSAKDTLNRLADKYVGDEDAMAELAEEDPKLLARLKAEFPKKFKDVKIPTKSLSEEDVDARVERIVNERLAASSNDSQLISFRKELGLSKIEFSDIEESVKEKAGRLMDSEIAESYDEALTTALELIKPSLARDLKARRNTGRKTSKMSSGKSAKKQEKNSAEKLEDSFSATMPKGWSAK